MNSQNNANEEGCCCCGPMMQETEEFKRLKPYLISGIFFYAVLLCLDIFYLGDSNLFYYIILLTCLCFFTFNRCFILLDLYTFLSILLIFIVAIPKIGIIAQKKFRYKGDMSGSFLIFFIYIFVIIFSCFIFYNMFLAYKDLKYNFMSGMGSTPGITPSYMATQNMTSSENYSSNNNNNSGQKKGFKAFSGKGYRVG